MGPARVPVVAQCRGRRLMRVEVGRRRKRTNPARRLISGHGVSVRAQRVTGQRRRAVISLAVDAAIRRMAITARRDDTAPMDLVVEIEGTDDPARELESLLQAIRTDSELRSVDATTRAQTPLPGAMGPITDAL